MFRAAVLRLTAWYLLIIVAIGLMFSAFIYLSSPREVRLGLHEVPGSEEMMMFGQPTNPGNLTVVRERAAESISHRLLLDLVEFNVFILLAGGVASYWLARRTLQPIEEALAAQSRFTADASHELRTPLTAMRSEIEVALRSGKLSKTEAIGLLRSNLEEVAKLEELSAGLLRLAQHDGGELPLEPVALAPAVAAAVSRHGKLARSRKVGVEAEIDPKLTAQGHREAITELLSILLDNAIKYSRDGGRVWVSAAPAGKLVVITVRDEGIGIRASDLPHIFERFYRADSSRSKVRSDGYGLGLSIAEKLARGLGGHVEVTSTPGKGSAFRVYLATA